MAKEATDRPSEFTIRYWTPDARLKGLVSGYHYYAINVEGDERHADVFYPAWANIRLQVAGAPWGVRIGERCFDPLPTAALFGPTSHAGYCATEGGAIAGAGLTPLGLTRLTTVAADQLADRVVPLADAIGRAADILLADVTRSAVDGRLDMIPRLLDTALVTLLGTPVADEARITALHRYLMDPSPIHVADAARALRLTPSTLNRLSRRSFGFTPKLLLRRARFLRSLIPLSEPSDAPWSARIALEYCDQSHFARDSRDFLGMPPGQFLRLPKPMNDASTRLRAQILGAPAQALDERSAHGGAIPVSRRGAPIASHD